MIASDGAQGVEVAGNAQGAGEQVTRSAKGPGEQVAKGAQSDERKEPAPVIGEADSAAAREVATAAEPWVRRLAHFGYAAKGVVYIVVGILAFRAALGVGGTTTDSEEALSAIFRQPLGPLLLAVVGLGLISYTAWRLGQSLLDLERKGSGLRGVVKRVAYAASGVAYGGLAITALRRSIGLVVTEGRSQEDWTAIVLGHPLGRWAVIMAGVLLAVLAVNAAVIAIRGLYRRKLRVEEMSQAVEGWATAFAVSGLLARGLVFGLLAVFFVQAGWNVNPEQAGGLSDVLVAIAAQPQGPWLLGATAAGLIAYGLFAVIQSRYRRVEVPQAE